MTTIAQDGPRPVTGGVDTHKDIHVAAVLDALGRLMATAAFPRLATATGDCSAGCNPTASSPPSASRVADRGARAWPVTSPSGT